MFLKRGQKYFGNGLLARVVVLPNGKIFIFANLALDENKMLR